MNSNFYKLAHFLNILPLQVLINSTKKRTILPFYHVVSNEDLIHIKHLYEIRSIKAFENDLDFFLKYYSPIDYQTFKNQTENATPFKKNQFLLSFDDGLREFHDIIAPILIKKGVPAICFLNSGFIDNKDLFFRFKTSILIEKLISFQKSNKNQNIITDWFSEKQLSFSNNYKSLFSINYLNKHYIDELADILEVDFNEYLQKHKPYLNTNQINALISQGFEFGAHSIDHPQFSLLKENDQLIQIEQSINDICSKFNLNYKTFSFPFSDFGVSKRFFETIFNSNKPISDLTFGCAGLKNDSCKKNIQRIPIEINRFSAQDVVRGEYLYYIFKAFLNKNTIFRN
ncbi:MAG: polysaccharide deacetylase family protein [Bacteroidota bacterium]